MLADGNGFGIKPLFSFSFGGRISFEHLLLISSSAILFGFSCQLTVIKCQHSSKPDALPAIFQTALSHNNHLAMRIFRNVRLILFILFVSSCTAQENPHAIADVYKNEKFDPEIIKDLKLYDTLKDILLTNIDTIFKYRNMKHIVHDYDENGKEKIVQHDEDWYNFIYVFGKGQSSDQIGLETLPAFIYPKVDTIFKQLGDKRIVGFDLQRNKIILNIILKNNYDIHNDVETQHTLDWDWDHTTDMGDFEKDTILSDKWIYYIKSSKRPGL